MRAGGVARGGRAGKVTAMALAQACERGTAAARGWCARAAALLRLVRFSHTLFALPWALGGLLLGARGWPRPATAGLVLVAMVAARTAAMAWNRLVDRRLDATNPRTAGRPSVTGEVPPRAMAALVLSAGTAFVVAAWALNPLCGWLSLPALAVLLGYSLTKRFTLLSHFVLGLALGLSPLGAWLGARGAFDAGAWAPVALGAGVLFWTAGFDILYACQDVDHDRREGLHSVPARIGIRRALIVARGCHAVVPAALALAGAAAGLGLVYGIAVAAAAVLLVVEHLLIRADDLSRLNRAFFQVNVAISVLMMLAVGADLAAGGGR